MWISINSLRKLNDLHNILKKAKTDKIFINLDKFTVPISQLINLKTEYNPWIERNSPSTTHFQFTISTTNSWYIKSKQKQFIQNYLFSDPSPSFLLVPCCQIRIRCRLRQAIVKRVLAVVPVVGRRVHVPAPSGRIEALQEAGRFRRRTRIPRPWWVTTGNF